MLHALLAPRTPDWLGAPVHSHSSLRPSFEALLAKSDILNRRLEIRGAGEELPIDSCKAQAQVFHSSEDGRTSSQGKHECRTGCSIGISFLYLLLALIVTTVQELIATWLRFRANDLYQAIADMLAERTENGDITKDELLKSFYDHPLIVNLRERKWRSNKLHLPSYIPSKTFALALLDVLRRTKTVSQATEVRPLLIGARDTVNQLDSHPKLQQSLLLVLENAGQIADRVDQKGTLIVTGIEDWFNDHMSRASGWYKRRAQTIALVLAGLVTFGANADSIHVIRVLWSNGALRDSIAAQAQTYAAAHALPPAPPAATDEPAATDKPAATDTPASDDRQLRANLKADIETLRGASFPIGWCAAKPVTPTDPEHPVVPCQLQAPSDGWWFAILGWLITSLAVSLGAGFWFDTLSKVLQLRGTGPKVSAATGETSTADA